MNERKILDILWANKYGDKKVTNKILDPNEGYIPIGIKIIEKDFLGDNEPARYVSTRYMFYTDRHIDSLSNQDDFRNNAKLGITIYEKEDDPLYFDSFKKNYNMLFDVTLKYVPKPDNEREYTLETLHNSKYISNRKNIEYEFDDIHLQEAKIVYGNFDTGFLPINITREDENGISHNYRYFNELEPDVFENTAGPPINENIPSLYDNGKYKILTHPNEYENSCLKFIHGKKQTYDIVNKYKDEQPLKNDDVIYVNKHNNYKNRLEQLRPFYCCSHYETFGTKQGDWYLPAIGELALLIEIQSDFEFTLINLFDVYGNIVNNYLYGHTYLWSSNQYDRNHIYGVTTSSGRISRRCYKSAFAMVLAFLEY